MQNPEGKLATVKIGSGDTTLRYTLNSGDFDWFVLTKTTTPQPPQVVAFAPNVADSGRAPYRGSYGGPINVQISDMSTTVDPASIKLKVDDKDVTPQVTKAGDITTVNYVTGLTSGQHSFSLSYGDSSSPAKVQTLTKTFTANPLGTTGQFLIEAEDFDYDSGKTKAAASTMPYTGGAYAGLTAVKGIDYNNDDGKDSSSYRDVGAAGEHVNMDAGPGDFNRGSWTMGANYKIGWVGDPDWQNYTRAFPAGDYNIYAALSYDDFDTAHRLTGKMQTVASGAGTATQTYTDLGSFDAPGTGGWGINNLVPMTDSSGSVAKVTLSGTQTLHYVATSGDTDYFLLVPATGGGGGGGGPKLTITKSGNNVTISSDSAATIESTDKLGTTYTTVGPAPQTVPIGTGAKFYRGKK